MENLPNQIEISQQPKAAMPNWQSGSLKRAARRRRGAIREKLPFFPVDPVAGKHKQGRLEL